MRALPADPVERASLLAGLALALASLATLGVIWAGDPALGRGLALQWVAHTALGKETGIPAGLALGVPWLLSALAAFAQDIVVLLLGFPLAAAAARGAIRWGPLARLAARPHPRYHRFADRTEAAGVVLLAATLWLPFLPSGALVAALAGRALGYRPRVLIPALVASALLSSFAFALLFAFAFASFDDPRLPWVLALGVAAVAAGVLGVVRWRSRG